MSRVVDLERLQYPVLAVHVDSEWIQDRLRAGAADAGAAFTERECEWLLEALSGSVNKKAKERLCQAQASLELLRCQLHESQVKVLRLQSEADSQREREQRLLVALCERVLAQSELLAVRAEARRGK